jgi:hypothetical protein
MRPPDDAADDDWDEDDPNDPSHPDHDLSTSAEYDFDRPAEKSRLARRWIALIIAVVMITGLVLPYLLNIF